MPEIASVPGLVELWEQTLGDPGVRVAILDGPAELSHPCFVGADLSIIEPRWLAATDDDGTFRDLYIEHSTHIASILFGQHGTSVSGVAPHCTGILVPIGRDYERALDPLNVARGIEAAAEAGANVIHVATCHATRSDDANGFVKRAVGMATQRGALVVAPSGNERGECRCSPALLPEVLAVGAYDDEGVMFKFSNWGPQYQSHGIAAPGGEIWGAAPKGGTAKHKGTSCSAPIVSGVAALLLSLQLKRGAAPDAAAVRQALLDSARPCAPEDAHGEPQRCMAGKLNVSGAVQLLFGRHRRQRRPVQQSSMDGGGAPPPRVLLPAAGVAPSQVGLSQAPEAPHAALVYVLGTLGYDFGSEARRDSFKQLMVAVPSGDSAVPANPYDARQMVDHLRAHPSEAKSLIWTLNLELTPIYALEAVGAFAAEVYELLTRLLVGEVAAEDSDAYIERVSIPGRMAGRTVKLFSGQVVPVVEVEARRGLYGWEINALVAAAVGAARRHPGDASDEVLRGLLREFLARIYYDLRNLGATSADRALNFAATNAFQAAETFASAVAAGMTLDSIGVEKSPFCRMDSDCWDVKLRFFDPENSRRARKVYRFTIDVSDLVPVTLGDVRTWSES